jgi:hypothetical protein
MQVKGIKSWDRISLLFRLGTIYYSAEPSLLSKINKINTKLPISKTTNGTMVRFLGTDDMVAYCQYNEVTLYRVTVPVVPLVRLCSLRILRRRRRTGGAGSHYDFAAAFDEGGVSR